MNRQLQLTAVVLALAGAIPGPAAAQEGRQMAAFVSPNVVCRVAPSSSADVAGFLRPMDGLMRGSVIEVEGTETSTDGEGWVHVGPAYTKWANLATGCWVHESVLAPVEGYALTEAHLLLAADRLLSAPEGRVLADLVTAHNLFDHPRYRELVAQSPALGVRQKDLLARALQVVETGRLAARDPLVLAWLESLGEEAGEAIQARTTPEPPPDARELAIIVPDAACRGAPAARGTRRGATLRLDHHFATEQADTTVSGEDWTFVFDGCWVLASQTAPGDSDEHVLAIADGFLSANEGRSVDNLLWVYNVLSGRKTGHRDAVDASGILSLRRLEVIERWLGTLDSFDADPLTVAVVQSLEEEVVHFDPGGIWILRDDAFLKLYEQHRDSPEAHEILWKFATATAYHDCEGSFACHAHILLNRVGRYWVAYPRGVHIAEAIKRARDALQRDLDDCNAAHNAAPDSPEANWREFARWEEGGAEAVRELRGSLTDVAEEVRAPLVEVLDALEGCAGGRGRPSARESGVLRAECRPAVLGLPYRRQALDFHIRSVSSLDGASPDQRSPSGRRLTTTDCTPSSSISTNAVSPPGPKAPGIGIASAAKVPR